jgi:putative transposase
MAKSSWGGRRAGAGRPRTIGVVPRRRRPNVSGRVNITLRLSPGVTVKAAQLKEALEGGSDRFGMKVVDFGVKSDRIQLSADVKNKKALSRGMQGLTIRLARAINRTSSHQGKVFADRYEVEE